MTAMQDTTLFETFRPIFKFMKIFGLYHDKRSITFACNPVSEEEPNGNKPTGKKQRCPLTISQFYSLIMTVIMVCNGIRLLSMFKKDEAFGHVLFLKIGTIAWYFLTTSNTVMFYRACGIMPQFFMEWQKLQDNFKAHNTEKPSYKRLVKILIVFVGLVIVLNTLTCSYNIYFTNSLEIYLAPFESKDTYPFWNQFMKAFYILWATLGAGHWMLPITLYFLMSKFS